MVLFRLFMNKFRFFFKYYSSTLAQNRSMDDEELDCLETPVTPPTSLPSQSVIH